MVKIKFKSYWTNNDDLLKNIYNRLTRDNNYIWNNLQIVTDDYDFLIVQGSTNENFDFENTIVIQYEPLYYREAFYNKKFLNKNDFFKYIDIDTYFSLDHWNIEANYQDLLNINCENKKDRISGLFSGTLKLEGHILRLNFIQNYLDKTDFYDSVSAENYKKPEVSDAIKNLRTFKGILKKDLYAFSEYKYIFAAESCYEKNYFTEKILRGILCECFVFYTGCPNIEDFVDSRCYIKLDLEKPEECLEIMKDALKNNLWEKRIDIIREQKRILMNENNLLNIIQNIIEKGEVKWKLLNKM